MDRQYDVVIVGAGPAGASAAACLHAGGLRVLVCESATVPRMKLCAGGLTPEAYAFVLDHFGGLPESVFAKPRTWRGLRLEFGDGGSPDDFIEINRHKPAAAHSAAHPDVPAATTSIRRDRLDAWLLERSGADVRDNCRLIGLEHDGDGVIVRLIDNRTHSHSLRCAYVIGADGAASMTRRLLSPSFDSTASWFAIYEEWFEGTVALDTDWYYIFVNAAFSDVFTSFCVKDDSLVYTSVSRTGGRPKRGFHAFINYQRQRYGLRAAAARRRWGCLVNNMGATANFTFGSGRVLLAGDAAGLIGFCGEGMSGGLVSGYLAAQAVLTHFDHPATALAEYRSSTAPLRERIRREHEFGGRLPGGVYSVYTGGPNVSR